MPDTPDERSGATAMLTAIRRRALTASTYAEWHQVGRDVETLAEQLATATAELGRMNKRAAFLDDALDGMRQQAIEAVKERNEATARAEKATATLARFGIVCCACASTDNLGYRNYRDQLLCWPCANGEPEAADAAQDGLGATETDGDGAQASVGVSTPVRASAGLSEPEPEGDPSVWCWAPNPHTLLHCGRLRDHEPPHQRGERTWTSDDTTEGR